MTVAAIHVVIKDYPFQNNAETTFESIREFIETRTWADGRRQASTPAGRNTWTSSAPRHAPHAS